MQSDPFIRELQSIDPAQPAYATHIVDRLLAVASEAQASDLHLQPTADGLDVRWRLNGVLEPLAALPAQGASHVIGRLKVLADLLTYKNDVPQEGRIRQHASAAEIRVSTFPTLYGEKAVVRLFARQGRLLRLAELGLGDDIDQALLRMVGETSGAILVTGPAGSGKTTTVYAALREIVAQSAGGRSIASLEDPIEVAVAGVSQTQVNAAADFDLASGLKFLLRQDPEVIMVGEIRDRPTAQTALQASLTGHLVLSTFHAGSAAGAVSRLADMGIEPYLLRSGVLAIICQRLVRRLCACARACDALGDLLDLPVRSAMKPIGCAACRATGYQGRAVLAEMLSVADGHLQAAVASSVDAASLEQCALEAGMVSRWRRAYEAIESGITSPAEVRRVLGFSETPGR